MNIKDAKDQIKNAMIAYFTKDENGEYEVPIEKQRPVFLMGPPGIGKTAIMEQIAAEMGVGLLSYSMTHHTRQSALGLPFIEHKNYKGIEYEISEYTMSEIIAAVYDMMEETGVEEGILFLDEINCVSETLAPIMLQFLQYKVFGRHRVPDGWIVVTAGNPPEYNNSVREFDIVTWDRLKRIDVEPDYDVWKEYAYRKSVHPAILSYLEIKKGDFYSVEATVDGKSFVTARGWDDLSQIIKLYEKNKLKVDYKLISQYLQNGKIAKNFAVYYDLFNKYKSDYQIDKILEGIYSKEIVDRAQKAKFDERLSVISLLLDSIGREISNIMQFDQVVMDLLEVLKAFKQRIISGEGNPKSIFERAISKYNRGIESGKKAGNVSREDIQKSKALVRILESQKCAISDEQDWQKAFEISKSDFEEQVKKLRRESERAKKKLENMFTFCDQSFSDGHEVLIIVTELTANPTTAQFISKYGCEEYYKHNKDLLFHERQVELEQAINDLKL